MVYRARKNCAKYKVKLDLTKKKVQTIENIGEFRTRKKLCFASAHANCRLCVMIGEEFHHMNSENDLHDIIREYDERSDTRSDTDDQQAITMMMTLMMLTMMIALMMQMRLTLDMYLC